MEGRGYMTLLLTGAPCAGKSTIASLLGKLLAQSDTKVIIAPETATALILAQGCVEADFEPMDPLEFQRRILSEQVLVENDAREMAEALSANGNDVLCIFDRGRRDGKLFCDASTWAAIDGDRISNSGQYDLIVHLTSLAVDAPALYDDAQRRGQNEARRHTREQSAALCPQFAALYHDMPCVTISGSAAPITYKLIQVLELLDDHVPPSMVHLKGRIGTQLARAIRAHQVELTPGLIQPCHQTSTAATLEYIDSLQ